MIYYIIIPKQYPVVSNIWYLQQTDNIYNTIKRQMNKNLK